MVIIAVGLAMDAFAVSLGVGTNGTANDKRSIFRLSFHFGLFQGLMTFLGWLAGTTISRWISSFDHWVALILLVIVGVNMIRSGMSSRRGIVSQESIQGGAFGDTVHCNQY